MKIYFQEVSDTNFQILFEDVFLKKSKKVWSKKSLQIEVRVKVKEHAAQISMAIPTSLLIFYYSW